MTEKMLVMKCISCSQNQKIHIALSKVISYENPAEHLSHIASKIEHFFLEGTDK